jgi:hypothetical protein
MGRCVNCGQDLGDSRSDRRTCSPKCRVALSRRLSRASVKRVRVPARVHSYITGTGWYQGQDTGELGAEYIAQVTRENVRADGSLSMAGDADFMRFLKVEAEYLADAARWGDNTMDDLADRNAARALIRRIDALGL